MNSRCIQGGKSTGLCDVLNGSCGEEDGDVRASRSPAWSTPCHSMRRHGQSWSRAHERVRNTAVPRYNHNSKFSLYLETALNSIFYTSQGLSLQPQWYSILTLSISVSLTKSNLYLNMAPSSWPSFWLQISTQAPSLTSSNLIMTLDLNPEPLNIRQAQPWPKHGVTIVSIPNLISGATRTLAGPPHIPGSPRGHPSSRIISNLHLTPILTLWPKSQTYSHCEPHFHLISQHHLHAQLLPIPNPSSPLYATFTKL